VKDGLRSAQTRFALPATQTSEVDHGFELRVTNLIALLSERGALPASEELWPFLHEHESLRDWAYGQVATLFGMNDELSRLAAIWCLRSMIGALVAAVLDGLLRHRLSVPARSGAGHDAFESGLLPVARSERASETPLLAAVGSVQHPCIDRVSTDVLRLVSVIERMLRDSASNSDATLLSRPRMNG
jgi:hypothetical protein